jgi:apolipoprotein N-acyltransferase
MIAGTAGFQLAYEVPALAFLFALFLFCVFQLAWVKTARGALWAGIALGMAVYAPQLAFFLTVFGIPAIALWMLLALWLGIFLMLARLCIGTFNRTADILFLPVLWTGLEYFRSELYGLRFSWLNAGFAFSAAPLLQSAGVYGVGFFLMAAVAGIHLLPRRFAIIAGVGTLLVLAVITEWQLAGVPAAPPPASGPLVVGIQAEEYGERDILMLLDKAIVQYPKADVLILSEYSFGGSIPPDILSWCRVHQKYLVAGGIDWVDQSKDIFRDTAFVAGPDGRIIFSQGKSVPVQFMADGLPAKRQRLWPSPWGKIGICICYDLSYARVTDELVRQGAQALIVPTMDMISWGRHEHVLHARVAPFRAAEYHIPIARVCSSGIWQIVGADGRVIASAGYPGQEEMLAARLSMDSRTRIPADRIVAPVCTALSAGVLIALITVALQRRRKRRASPGQAPTR